MPDFSRLRLVLFAVTLFSIATKPAAVAARGIQQVTLGVSHACAIVSGGKLLCWGDNHYGQTGIDGTWPDDHGPVEVIADGVTEVASGFRATCAVARSALICWGDNIGGRFGNGTSGGVLRPTRILDKGVSLVAMGTGQTCAVVTGALWCWGSNQYGQVGNGEAGDTVVAPTRIIATGVTSVSAGAQNTCAVVSAVLWCWGSNEIGQIGTGTLGGYGAKVLHPAQVIADGVTAVSAGYGSTCAVVSGALWCWGNNDGGELGSSSVEDMVPKPTQILKNGVTAVSSSSIV